MTQNLTAASNRLDVSTAPIADQQHYGDTLFPLAYICQSPDATLEQAAAWVKSNRDLLLDESSRHGAVLFRGFPMKTANDFDIFMAALDVPNFPYKKSLSNAVRVNFTERVFSANEAPPDVQIFFHHEMAQTPIFPERIAFFCEIAAAEGGATPICRSDVLYDRLKAELPDFIRDCESRGLRYTNVMPAANDPNSGMGRSWKSTLEVETTEAAEARLRDLNYSWEWLPDGCLKATTPPLPAVMDVTHGRKTFFNQLIAAYCGWKDTRNDPSAAIRHGDDSILDAGAVRRAIEIANELAFDLQWQPGDAVLIDNTIAMHARRTFQGKRKVLASLMAPRTQSFQS
ncbi:Taurine catabolism dioxygenase TauD, TfdA family [Caulifigura coniformis]|uniref:Taurine catabolism dioxygenase TauD, TfdA family n=1 Tax=Caulifigura coniformis TaxID=2527983 RepID=A0A517S8Y2_9PLAN|nr:TauD/TfdA family dioxygenase [Caulifigura coniformis]QDT52597.1 Taurine catabolism dioxygenase TauD, TfdA family [Caulifigura coniformis]